MGKTRIADTLTLNDVEFDRSPIIPIYGAEGYEVDEEELRQSIERSREILISHGHDNLFHPDSL